ncbi:MAG: cupin domain-containing protein [Chloroflexi bacterium]|nr:cupin domain-containing protein [Chloroflexota bacterium]
MDTIEPEVKAEVREEISPDLTGPEAVARLNRDMQRNSLTPLWQIETNLMSRQPRTQTLPWLWKWSTLYDIAERAGALVPIERGGDRRAIALSNPGLEGRPFATPTLWTAVQWLNGHEVAPAHRHTAQAIRFIIEGNGSWSTVEGDRVFLERGDLVLTPPWLWHDHGSKSDERAIWLDGLDIPLNNYLDASFFEPYKGEAQAVTQALNGTVLKYGVGQMRPAWEKRSVEYSPIFTYKWTDTERALDNLAQVASSPYDDIALEYTNPHTGGPVMPAFSAWIQMLRPGIHTQAHRQVGSSVYHVFEGSGETIINGVSFRWEKGDFFVVPSWAWHEHHNLGGNERAILFSLHDTPLLLALNKYREESYQLNNGHQEITGTFQPV